MYYVSLSWVQAGKRDYPFEFVFQEVPQIEQIIYALRHDRQFQYYTNALSGKVATILEGCKEKIVSDLSSFVTDFTYKENEFIIIYKKIEFADA